MNLCAEEWSLRQRSDDVDLEAAFDHGFDAVLAAIAARDRLDEQIMMVAVSPRFADPVNRLVNQSGFEVSVWCTPQSPEHLRRGRHPIVCSSITRIVGNREATR